MNINTQPYIQNSSKNTLMYCIQVTVLFCIAIQHCKWSHPLPLHLSFPTQKHPTYICHHHQKQLDEGIQPLTGESNRQEFTTNLSLKDHFLLPHPLLPSQPPL